MPTAHASCDHGRESTLIGTGGREFVQRDAEDDAWHLVGSAAGGPRHEMVGLPPDTSFAIF